MDSIENEEENGIEYEMNSIPHYMLPNFASILPSYTNYEQDQIREAFSTGNYQALSKIPNKIAPDEILKMKQTIVDKNLSSSGTMDITKLPKIITKNGMFSQFEYIPSRYSLADEISKWERIDSESKRLQISGKDFVASGNQKKLKHEEVFEEDQNKTYPYMSEPYELASDEILRKKWLKDKQILHGPFIPSGASKALQIPTRIVLPDIIKQLHQIIYNDWDEYKFTIAPTDDDNIAIRFEESSIQNAKGLTAYMNVLARSHILIQQYSLSKVIEDWDAKPGDGGLYFVLRPPWAKPKMNDSFLSLYSESELNLSS